MMKLLAALLFLVLGGVLVCGLCAVGLGKVKLTDEVCRMALDNMR